MKKLLIGLVVFVSILLALLYRPAIPLEKLKAKYTDEHSHFLEMGNQNIHYKVQGAGMPLLLVHGTSSSLHTWGGWTEILSEHFKVYSVDLPGCGLTGPHHDHQYDIEMYTDFLTGFTHALGIDSLYIAGNSLGGHIAWEFARISPKVKKAVLVDPSGFYLEQRDPPLVFRLGKKKIFASVVESLNVKPLIKKSLKDVFYDDSKITPELLQRYSDLLRRKGNRQAFIKKVSYLELSPEEELEDITCPVLIQWGKQDIWIPVELSEIFLDHLPDREIILYDNCGHVPQEEIPELSARDALEFLNRPIAKDTTVAEPSI